MLHGSFEVYRGEQWRWGCVHMRYGRGVSRSNVHTLVWQMGRWFGAVNWHWGAVRRAPVKG